MLHHTMKFIHLCKNYVDLPGYILVVQGENVVPLKKNRPGKEKQHTPEEMLQEQKADQWKSEAKKVKIHDLGDREICLAQIDTLSDY